MRALIALTVLVALRAATESAPPPHVARILAASVRVPGGRPTLEWPSEGEAALQLQGLEGSREVSGAATAVPIASVAKVMTAYLTLIEHPLAAGQQGFVLKISRADVMEEGQRKALDESVLNVRRGERLSERQALEALLLPSANNIAWLLARHEGGLTAFVQRMNATAARLGMRSTLYTDPSGFQSKTVSTALDQLKLAQAAMQLPEFAALVARRSAALPIVGRVVNLNALVGQDGYVGVKTGSDDAAGGCLMWAKRVGVAGKEATILGVVLGQRSGPFVEAALVSARRLGDSAAAALRVRSPLPAGSRVLRIASADGRRTTASTAGSLSVLAWGGASVPVQLDFRATADPARAGQRLATARLAGPGALSATAVVTSDALAGPSLGWRLSHLF
jgi:serine-type D-Ala-D-Ala carboxypeptidase (penicillin-binding protein 5/6)